MKRMEIFVRREDVGQTSTKVLVGFEVIGGE